MDICTADLLCEIVSELERKNQQCLKSDAIRRMSGPSVHAYTTKDMKRALEEAQRATPPKTPEKSLNETPKPVARPRDGQDVYGR